MLSSEKLFIITQPRTIFPSTFPFQFNPLQQQRHGDGATYSQLCAANELNFQLKFHFHFAPFLVSWIILFYHSVRRQRESTFLTNSIFNPDLHMKGTQHDVHWLISRSIKNWIILSRVSTPTIITAALWSFQHRIALFTFFTYFAIFYSVCVHKLVNWATQRTDNVQLEVNNFQYPIYEHWYELYKKEFKDASSQYLFEPHLRFTKASEIEFDQTWNLISKSFGNNSKKRIFLK